MKFFFRHFRKLEYEEKLSEITILRPIPTRKLLATTADTSDIFAAIFDFLGPCQGFRF